MGREQGGVDMTPVTRHIDWKARLAAYLGRMAQRKGAIGTHDCALFSAGAVEVMTGWQPDPALLRYRTEAGGLRKLRGAGFADLPDYVSSIFEEQPVLRARPGDLALVARPEGEALGIVQGDHVYAVASRGIGMVPKRSILRSWRVG